MNSSDIFHADNLAITNEKSYKKYKRAPELMEQTFPNKKENTKRDIYYYDV